MPEVALTPPRVAVIVPAYGVAHLLAEALGSLQAQTMPDWECVVIDDGAPDDVAGAVAPYLSDPRIRFIATSNHGVSSARNTAIAATSAPLLALLDGDDLLRPEYLATTVPLLEADPAVRLVTINARIFGAVARERLCFVTKQGTGDGLRGSLADVLDRSFGVYIGSTFRRADFDAIGGFDTKMAQSEDFDLWVRLMQLGGYAWYADQVLGEYRVRANSASASSARLLMGNIRTYEKARSALAADAPEQPLLARLIAESQDALDFEHAIDRVVDGDTVGGLAELRRLRSQFDGAVWALSFALWRIAPATARPMLAWRRRAHSRGGTTDGAAALLAQGTGL
jgi:glycosyltransferase involved in cell wall biosynthesis